MDIHIQRIPERDIPVIIPIIPNDVTNDTKRDISDRSIINSAVVK